jgi:DNA-binding CsgD family transcriptional regulator
MRRRGRPPHPDILTPREWEVLALVEEGASNDEIAQRLGITERTAKYHVSEIMSKLGVSSREEAVAAIGERGVEPKLSRWALFVRIGAALAAAALLAGVAFLAWGVLQGGDDSGVPSNTTIEELYSRVLSAATRPDQILHTTFEYTGRDESGDEKQVYVGEYWLDVATDTVRAEAHPGADNTDPEAGHSLSMLQGPYQYYQDSETVALRSESTSLCPGSTSAVISVLLACGGGPDTTRNESQIDTDADWEGHRAIAIETLLTPAGFTPETAPPTTTAAPLATAGQTILTPPPNPAATSSEPAESASRWTVYLDAGTLLPLASVYDYNLGSPDSTATLVVRYEHEFIDRSELPADYFDPRSIGYGTPDSAGELSDLAKDVPVYWLGEDIPASPGLPELVLERVQPAALSYAAKLWYRGPNG